MAFFPSGKGFMSTATTNFHMLFRMIRKIKVSRRLVGCVLDISFNVAVFSESVTLSSFCFTDVKLIAIRASYAVNKIGGGTRKVISDLNEYLESRCFLYVITEIASFVS